MTRDGRSGGGGARRASGSDFVEVAVGMGPLGARLRAARRAAGLTQDAAAYQLAVHRLLPLGPGPLRHFHRRDRVPQSFVSKCEAGKRRVRRYELEAFATVYQCSVERLTGGAESGREATEARRSIDASQRAPTTPRRNAAPGRASERPVATRLRPYHTVPARGADGRWRKADAPVVCGPPPGSPAGYPRWTKRRLRSVGARVPAVTWRYVDDAPVHDPVGQAARRVELSSLIAAPTWCGLHRFSASLLEALEVYDAVGRTPLYEAVELGCVEAARDLVVLGSDVGRRLNTWWAAAHRPLTPWAAALVCSDPARMLYTLTASDTCYGLDLQPDVVRLVLEPLTGYGTAHPMATVKTRSREPAEPESPSWCAREVLRVLATLCRRRVFYYYGHAPAGPGLPHSVALELPFVPSVSDGR